ncbi:uncharacterized protein ACN427_006698 isoform 1-T1 [Glossina fuscipes fuscipes]
MIARVVLIFTILIHISLGLYIRPAKENKTTKPVVENMKSDAGEWKMFQQMLNLTDKKVELLKAQKDQQETKNLLYRFIRENPKLINTNNNNAKESKLKKSQNNTQQINNILKPSKNYELKNKSQKDINRPIHTIAVKQNFDMSSVKFCQLLKLFLMKRKLLSHSNNINYGEPDNNIPRDDKLHNFICDDSIIFYKNDYKSEGEVSMQDLIFQAVLDYWRQDMEERKFMNSRQE